MKTTRITPSTFLVRTAAARMPGSCWGQYRRVAVLECDPGVAPKMISARARGVRDVVMVWEKCNVGRGGSGRCAFSRARRAAEELAAELTAAQAIGLALSGLVSIPA